MALLHASVFYTGNITTVNPTFTTIYTVATGQRIILRSVAYRNLAPSAAHTLYLEIDSTLVWSTSIVGGALGAGEFRPWIVVGPGSVLKMAADASSGFGVVVSGSIYTI